MKRPRFATEPGADKSPRVAVVVQPGRQPRLGADPNTIFRLRMTWCITRADTEGTWTWGQDRQWTEGEWTALISPKMTEFTRLTWSEIEAQVSNGRRMHHSQDLDSLDEEAQARWTQLGIETDEAYRFRMTGRGRAWGFRIGPHFHFLWWDAEHQIYKVAKRHT